LVLSRNLNSEYKKKPTTRAKTPKVT